MTRHLDCQMSVQEIFASTSTWSEPEMEDVRVVSVKSGKTISA